MTGTDVGQLGVWYFTEAMPSAAAAGFAQRLEGLGYSTLWLPETTGRNPLIHAGFLLQQTSSLVLATGIANIYHRHPAMAAQSANTLAEQSGGRFVLGLGVSHAPLVSGLRKIEYGKPVTTMRAYLESYAEAPYSSVPPAQKAPVVIAALGPKMLDLAGELTHGAHPYLTTPEHTAKAREILGPDKWLCVEQKVILCTDPEKARKAARETLAVYIGLPNYYKNWFRLGFEESDLEDGGSDRLIDALFAWGDEEALRARVQAHFDAGASHVCLQPVGVDAPMGTPDWDVLEALAPNA